MATLYETLEKMCYFNEINITTMCRESGASRSSITDLKKGRSERLTAETLDKLARYFHVTIDFLLDPSDTKYNRLGGGGRYYEEETEPTDDEIDELLELQQAMKERPELKTLFHLSKNAKPSDVRKMLKMLELLKEDDVVD